MDIELTLLKRRQVENTGDYNSRLSIFDHVGIEAKNTDASIVTGGDRDKTIISCIKYANEYSHYILDTFSDNFIYDIYTVYGKQISKFSGKLADRYSLRPVLKLSPLLFDKYFGDISNYITLFGEYPQSSVTPHLEQILEFGYSLSKLKETGRTYTFIEDINKSRSKEWSNLIPNYQPVTYKEYEYKGNKYIRVESTTTIAGKCWKAKKFKLSNNKFYTEGDIVWLKVEPVRWLIDHNSKLLISEKSLLSGVSYYKYIDKGNKNVIDFLNKYMLPNIIQSCIITLIQEETNINELLEQISEYLNKYSDKELSDSLAIAILGLKNTIDKDYEKSKEIILLLEKIFKHINDSLEDNTAKVLK